MARDAVIRIKHLIELVRTIVSTISTYYDSYGLNVPIFVELVRVNCFHIWNPCMFHVFQEIANYGKCTKHWVSTGPEKQIFGRTDTSIHLHGSGILVMSILFEKLILMVNLIPFAVISMGSVTNLNPKWQEMLS